MPTPQTSTLLKDANGNVLPQGWDATASAFAAVNVDSNAMLTAKADGADAALGATTDADAMSGDSTVTARLGGIRAWLARAIQELGAAIGTYGTLMAGSDGTNARAVNTDTSGRLNVVGAAASGAAVAGNPVLIGGSDGTNARSIKTDGNGVMQTGETWAPLAVNDIGVGNLKIFTVPASSEYDILSAYVTYTATATAGNRVVYFIWDDGTNTLGFLRVGVNITAGQTKSVNFAPGLPRDTAFDAGDKATCPIPAIRLKAAYRVRIGDASNVDSGDTCAVRLLVLTRTV